MPVVTNQYQFSFNGFSFGGAGSPYQILSVEGLEGLPDLRVQDDNRGYIDGMFSGRDFLAGRRITLTMQIFGSGATSAQTNYNTLQQKLIYQTSGTTPLYFKIPPVVNDQFIDCRVRTLKTSITPEYTYGMITAQVEFFAPDPKYYDNTLQTASLSVSNPPGRIYNRTYNLVYGTGSIATTTSVTNNGWATTYPTITLNGPILNPILGNATTGEYLSISGSYSNTDSLVVDLENRLITLNGASARNLLSSGVWFDAPPGTSQYYMTGSLTVPGTTLATVSWYSAYV